MVIITTLSVLLSPNPIFAFHINMQMIDSQCFLKVLLSVHVAVHMMVDFAEKLIIC